MKILVTGATGQQGRAVVDALLSGEFGEHEVYGLTRDLTTERARSLVERGVHVVAGDMRDHDRMVTLLEGVEGVFCVTTPFETRPVTATEQGTTMVDAAAETGVSNFVYASVAGAERAPLPHFQSKFDVETHLRDSGLSATVVRPAYFMQNFARLRDDIEDGTLPLPLSPETTLHLADVDDIGRAAAAAFADPDRFLGETFELAGDALTVAAIANTFSDAVGHPVEVNPVDEAAYREQHGDTLADMYAWLESGGYDVPISDLSRFGLVPRTLSQYLGERDAQQPSQTAIR